MHVVSMQDVEATPSRWLIDGLLPIGGVTALVGDEGIGKGLYWVHLIARLAAQGHRTLVIAGEDDYGSAVRPRLDIAGADPSMVDIVVRDTETLTGVPYLPTNTAQVRQIIEDQDIDFLVIDPWVSVVPSQLSLKDTQQARGALDPLVLLAKQTETCILTVVHTNRSGGSTRDRVGLTAALRQAARVLLLAIEDPSDETQLIVGVDKANGARRDKSTRFVKSGSGDAWGLSVVEESDLSIREWDNIFRTTEDPRTSDKWPEVCQRADDKRVTRTQITEVYDGNQKSADKAIGRWCQSGRLRRESPGMFVVVAV